MSVGLTAETVARLARLEGLVAGKAHPVSVWVTLLASHTAKAAQTVRATGTYVRGGPVSLDLALPPTAWTPNGAVAFTLGAAGTIAGPYAPYGGAVVELGTERQDARLDCVAGAIRIADAAIPWSHAGRTGSAGRYAIDLNPDTPVFARVADGTPAPPPPVVRAAGDESPAAVVPPPPVLRPVRAGRSPRSPPRGCRPARGRSGSRSRAPAPRPAWGASACTARRSWSAVAR